MKRCWVWCFATVLTVAGLGAAGAFQLRGDKWPTPQTTLSVAIPGQSPSGVSWQNALIEAASSWNAKTGFTFETVPTFADPCDTFDGQNGAAFFPSMCGLAFDPTTLAITISLSMGGTSVEADIVFNENIPWDVYSGPWRGLPADFRRVAVHELGHVLGLVHEDRVPAIMATLAGDIEVPQPDDISGVGALYGSALVAAVLPSSRSVQVGTTATAFATVINTNTEAATACRIVPLSDMTIDFVYQTTDFASNTVTGSPNTPVDIPAGTPQSFVLFFTPTSPFPAMEVQLSFTCANIDPAISIIGLNTLLLSASATPIPDIVALAATLTNDGIVRIAAPTGVAAFSVATVNVGIGGTITAAVDTAGVELPLSLVLCETHATTGACLTVPNRSVTTQMIADATSTFSVFIAVAAEIPFNPASNRIFVRFRDAIGVTRGAASVAVQAP